MSASSKVTGTARELNQLRPKLRGTLHVVQHNVLLEVHEAPHKGLITTVGCIGVLASTKICNMHVHG